MVFKKGHRQSEESRKKMSLARKGKASNMKGKKHKPQALQKMSKTWFVRGQTSWNKGKTGVMPEPWNKGKPMSEEQRKKMESVWEKNKGKSPWNKGKTGVMPEPWNKGKKASLKLRKKISEGHKGQTPWNKGKPMSEKQKKKISDAKKGVKYSSGRFSAMKGKKQTEEAKRKISIGNKGRITSDITKLKLSKANTGKKASEVTKRKLRLAHLGLEPWNKGKTNVISEEAREKIRKARAKQVFPLKDTKPEKYLQGLLRGEKIKFETHRNFVKKGIRIYGQPDIFIEPNICIFVDGDYWHCNPNDYVYKKKLNPGFKANDQITGKKYAKDKWARDKGVNSKLKEKDYIVLRFWQSELETNPEKCIKKILKKIQKR